MSIVTFFSRISVIAVALLFISNHIALGATQTLTTPDGAKVQINVKYKNGSTAQATANEGGSGDEDKKQNGKFVFTVPDQKNVSTKEIKSLGVFGAVAANVLDFNLAGMDTISPVDLFVFSSTDEDDIVAVLIDVPTFLSGGSGIVEGQTYTVNNGTIPGVPGLSIHNANSIYTIDSFFDVFFDIPIYDSLPLYDGTVVSGLDQLQVVPEPATMLLLGSGLAGLLRFGSRRKTAA